MDSMPADSMPADRLPGMSGQTSVPGNHGSVVILNGPPRAGKSSIAQAMQDRLDGVWINLGVDAWQAVTPRSLLPGIGLRPGGERPDLEPAVVSLYRGLFAAAAATTKSGLNTVVDVGLHDDYSQPLGIRSAAGTALAGLPVLFVGVHCPVNVVLQRRRETWGGDGFTPAGSGRDPVQRWHEAVHTPGRYDLEVDTAALDPHACAEVIGAHLRAGLSPSAFFA